MRILVPNVFLLLLLIGCKGNSSKESTVQKASWLLGTWETTTQAGRMVETWDAINDSVFSAKAYLVKGKDTLHHETITLFIKDKQLCYAAQVLGQNNNLPVYFYNISKTADKLVFANPAHDFPQKITYIKKGTDYLSIALNGIQQGKNSAYNYQLRRKK